jgi:hypothetical protein
MSWKGAMLRAGIASDGVNVKVPGGTITARNLIAPSTNVWYVDSAVTTTGTGKSWSSACKTIAAAVALAAANDTILIAPSATNYSEAVTNTLSGISFIGMGSGPVGVTWTAPTVAGSFCLHLNAATNCLIQNIKFRPVIYTGSGVPAGVKLTNAHYTRIIGCRFQGQAGSIVAIYSPVSTTNTSNVLIQGNQFLYMNNITTTPYGAAIYGTEAAGSYHSNWQILDNEFNSCSTAIDICARVSLIKGNTISEYGVTALAALAAVLGTTHGIGIDLSGSGSGANVVTQNQLGGTYGATLYAVGASGDQWAGNYNVFAGTAGLTLTAANPA